MTKINKQILKTFRILLNDYYNDNSDGVKLIEILLNYGLNEEFAKISSDLHKRS